LVITARSIVFSEALPGSARRIARLSGQDLLLGGMALLVVALR